MERVLIIGSNGAGKSTFSYALAEKTNLPLTHLDQLYWRNNWEMAPREEFLSLVSAEAQKPRWIIEGNNIRSLAERLKYADTVFWFEFSPARCVWNVLKRVAKYHGRVRPDMPDQCVCRLDLTFLKEVQTFNRKNHDRIAKILGETNGVQVIRFTDHQQVEAYLQMFDKGENYE